MITKVMEVTLLFIAISVAERSFPFLDWAQNLRHEG